MDQHDLTTVPLKAQPSLVYAHIMAETPPPEPENPDPEPAHQARGATGWPTWRSGLGLVFATCVLVALVALIVFGLSGADAAIDAVGLLATVASLLVAVYMLGQGRPTGRKRQVLLFGVGGLLILSIGLLIWNSSPPTRASIPTAIDSHYLSLAGPDGRLGRAVAPESIARDGKGRYREFEHGVIYWHPETGAHDLIRDEFVQHSILEKWKSVGDTEGLLGYPVTEVRIPPDRTGRFAHFQGGSIYWHPDVEDAHEIHGEIKDEWAKRGWELGFLRYPISDEKRLRDSRVGGRFSSFQGGVIKWLSPGQIEVYRTCKRQLPKTSRGRQSCAPGPDGRLISRVR